MDSDNQTEDIKEEKSHLLPGLSEVAVVEEEPLGDETVGAVDVPLAHCGEIKTRPH